MSALPVKQCRTCQFDLAGMARAARGHEVQCPDCGGLIAPKRTSPPPSYILATVLLTAPFLLTIVQCAVLFLLRNTPTWWSLPLVLGFGISLIAIIPCAIAAFCLIKRPQLDHRRIALYVLGFVVLCIPLGLVLLLNFIGGVLSAMFGA
jgi:hypothetical protein